MSEQIKEVPRKTYQPLRLELAEARRHDWIVVVPHTVLKEDIMNPEFWTHVAPNVLQFDLIEVRWEDGSKVATLRVESSVSGLVKVRLKEFEELDSSDYSKVLSTKYEVSYGGPVQLHRIVRLSDHKIIEQGISKKSDAYARLSELE